MNDLKRRDILKRTALLSTMSWLAGCNADNPTDPASVAEPTTDGGSPATPVSPTASPTPSPAPAPTPPAPSPATSGPLTGTGVPDPIPAPVPPPSPLAVMPAWRQGQAINEWREITGTDIAALPATNEARTTAGVQATGNGRSFGARVGAWCGLSIDTRSATIYSVANGGHGDYYGNEVVAINLGAEAPRWTEVRTGSSGNVIYTYEQLAYPADRKFAQYSDGLPVSRHSYYGQQFIERHNRALAMGGATSMLGSFYENVESFDITTNAWDRYNPETQEPLYGYAIGGINKGWTPATGWSTCKDPRNEYIYTIASATMHRFVPNSSGSGGTWSTIGSVHPDLNPGTYAGTAIDTQRNRLVWMLGWGLYFQPYTCDLSTKAWTRQTFAAGAAKDALIGTLPLVSPGAPQPFSPGMVYVPPLDKLFVRMAAGGGRVFVIDPATFEVSDLATTGGAGVPDAAPFGDQQGIFTRWLYAPTLGGIVYVPNGGRNVWFLRLY